MFKFLITIQPLGLMYGSAGAFLSPENLVGRSGTKFPPDAATVSGLIFSANKEQKFASYKELSDELHVAGPFWTFVDGEDDFYVPLPRHKVIGEDHCDEWVIQNYKWSLKSESERDDSSTEENMKMEESEYRWLRIDYWDDSVETIYNDRNEDKPSVAKSPWKFTPVLHPQLKQNERHVLPEDGLFLENAVQMEEDTCLVYLSNYHPKEGWYQFGGEGHMVEVKSIPLADHLIERLQAPIKESFALITLGVWGSNHLSYRYPKHSKEQVFAEDNNKIMMLTHKAVPYRYRIGYGDKEQQDFRNRDPGRLSRGRYAVPAGSVYVLREPLNRSWWDFPKDWFPEKGLLRKMGCGLCLPITLTGC
ncbi:MAG: type III-B CRISPR module-associated protein Cmr3 [Cyanobacteria bacterium LVE1205-1]|jgi:CRISPR-associated protein Cmr3